ncbi:MAG: PDZ domain-containing protein [Flavobacteriaceae bacterium]|nr:PDZ domain-containing protein [Flavobacteriaceae bacterium]
MAKQLFFLITLFLLASCGSSSTSIGKNKQDLAKLKFGIEVADLNKDINNDAALSHGIIVTNVYSFYPASKAGIVKGDIIIRFNDTTIFDHEGFKKLLERNKYTYGQVSIDVFRDGKMQEIKVYLE